MNEDKTKWIVAGVLGVAILGGGAALAISRKPKAIDWYGYAIRVEDRELDDATKPLRWTVAKDDKLLGSGLAETQEIAVDQAKSLVEGLQEAQTAANAAANAARSLFDAAREGEVG